ncbi:MAG: triose-phosphate isomerase [Bacteroidetes bacterium]|nr:triose-phosphate isomerase [Bacteroidota bacterium]
MRKKIVAGNWKMNKTFDEAKALMNELKTKLNNDTSEIVEVVVCPPFLCIPAAKDEFAGTSVRYGGQNIHFKDDGAFTGEISASMLKAVGCEYVILGHSERRQYFHETNHLINFKVIKALEKGLKPILCVGETLEQREQGIEKKIVDEQVTLCLKDINAAGMDNVVIAYEPVWAIGTGKTATPQQAEEMHIEIRKSLENLYNATIAGRTRILYGGSMNDKNAKELLGMSNIDGGLIGGAALKADSFITIIEAAK